MTAVGPPPCATSALPFSCAIILLRPLKKQVYFIINKPLYPFLKEIVNIVFILCLSRKLVYGQGKTAVANFKEIINFYS
jgi:hypothetical protein